MQHIDERPMRELKPHWWWVHLVAHGTRTATPDSIPYTHINKLV
jgi:hypothetical protein